MGVVELTAEARAEQVARASCGRLLAVVAAQTGDIPAAEDALGDAFERAMLQTVLGFDAAFIARAYALPETTMAQRLVRAKRRIRLARVPFVVPVLQDMPARLPFVLEAIYGAYTIDWQLVAAPTVRESLAAEAFYLAKTLAALLGDEPEALALAALIAFSLARVDARVADDGCLVPLADQDRTLSRAELVGEGEGLLRRAHGRGSTSSRASTGRIASSRPGRRGRTCSHGSVRRMPRHPPIRRRSRSRPTRPPGST